MTIKTAIQILIGVAGYCTWAFMAYFDPTLRPDFLKFNVAMAVGTIGLTLRDMNAVSPAPPPDKQSGRASPWILAALGLSALMLTGCTSLQFAGNASYSVKPFVVDAKTGATVCCQVDIHDGKERQSLDLHVIKDGDKYDITLSEKAVSAFVGQQIAMGATQGAIDAAGKVATAAALAPLLPALMPAAGAVLSSGAGGAIVGGAALGVTADKFLAPAPAK